MRKGAGKQKGAGFERKICVALSLWISKGERKDLFWRSAMSGGRATVQLRKGDTLRAQCGDISPVDAEGCPLTNLFFIECKFLKSLDLEGALIHGRGKLVNAWMTASREAEKYDKHPMVIAKQNGTPVLLLVAKDGEKLLMLPGRASILNARPLAGVRVYLFSTLLQQKRNALP